MKDDTEFFEQFSIKVIAENTDNSLSFLSALCDTHKAHALALEKGRPSQNGKYLSYQLTLKNIDKANLDKVYLTLTQEKCIKWTL